jgi:hypothetical protein
MVIHHGEGRPTAPDARGSIGSVLPGLLREAGTARGVWNTSSVGTSRDQETDT